MRKIWIIIIAISILTPIAVYAWEDCPYGLINDPFPGQCPRYIDTNNDGICDHSQPPPESTVNITQTTTDQGGKRRGKDEDIDLSESQREELKYYLLPITFFFMLLYIPSHLLYKNKTIKRRTHRKIWNIILVASFLVSGITGLVLIILINYGIQSHLRLDIAFWHGEAGIVMAVTSLFHVHIYWKPFKRIFKELL